jgi:hypothetical protein
MLVVRGALDPIVPQDWAERVTELLPKGDLAVIPGRSHSLDSQAAQQLAELAAPFLRRWRGSGGGALAKARRRRGSPISTRRPAWCGRSSPASRVGRSRSLGLGLPLRLGAPRVNLLPPPLRKRIYALGGLVEAMAPEKLSEVRDDVVARWMTSLFPAERYPGVAIGASNGALVHLWARLGIPWLPQTCLIPVRQWGVGVDRPDQAMAEGARHAQPLLEANPDLQLHQMHDASRDRLMIRHMMYFRVKRRRLSRSFRSRFAFIAPWGGRPTAISRSGAAGFCAKPA